MANCKTYQKNRNTYVYEFCDGTKIEVPTSAVDAQLMALIHEMDKEEILAEEREKYHARVHYDSYGVGADGIDDGYNPLLADNDANPEVQLMELIDRVEHQKQLDRLKNAVKNLTPTQKDMLDQRFTQNKTYVEIAKDQGVTEKAIRKRFATIFKTLKKYF